MVAGYNKSELIGIPTLYWGGDLENLQEMKYKGIFYEIDEIFNPIYIDAYVDLYVMFKKNISQLLFTDEKKDESKLKDIDDSLKNLNTFISELSGVKSFEEKISPEYNKYKNENLSISIKSEIAVKGIYSSVVPYIKRDDDEILYPTSGEGRKKLLTYAIFNILSEDNDFRKNKFQKINIFLIEEPENHLHRAMQITLSNILFVENRYNYLFITTHSSYILSEMDKVNLIRIYNENKIESSSIVYNVPTEFVNNKKALNSGLTEAIFFDKVLLVEGPSECILFDKVFREVEGLYYESKGIYILCVDGFGFKPYYDILRKLDIKCVIKTDNDLRKPKNKDKYDTIGFNRINDIINDENNLLPKLKLDSNKVSDKREIYEKNIDTLDKIAEQYYIFLSRCSLEEDLDEVVHEEMKKYLNKEDPVKYLKDAKKKHMIELVEKLKKEDCEKIYDHYNFRCLKEVLK